MSKIKINVGQQVNLYRTYQYEIDEDEIIKDFGSIETFGKFVEGELSEEEVEKLNIDEYEVYWYLRNNHDYTHYDEDDDDIKSDVSAIGDEPWDSTRGRFFR